MKLISEEETDIDDELPKEPVQRKKRTQRSKLEAPVNIATLNNSLSGAFNAAAFITKSDTRFTADDFDDSSKKILNFINLFPPARILIHLIGPITTIVDFVAKFQSISEGRKAREAAKAQANGQATINYPTAAPMQRKSPFS